MATVARNISQPLGFTQRHHVIKKKLLTFVVDDVVIAFVSSGSDFPLNEISKKEITNRSAEGETSHTVLHQQCSPTLYRSTFPVSPVIVFVIAADVFRCVIVVDVDRCVVLCRRILLALAAKTTKSVVKSTKLVL